MVDRGEESAKVGRGLLEQEAEIFKQWHQVQDARMSRIEFQIVMKLIRQAVKRLFQVGAQLRRAVLWRRKSYGTQSESGRGFVERILTVITSLRQQGGDMLEYVTAACEKQPCGLLP